MSTKNKKAPKAPGKRKKTGKKSSNRGLAIIGVLAVAALIAVLLVVGIQATRHYHSQIIVDEVESLVGVLEPEGVTLQVSKGEEGEAIVEALKIIERRGFGSFKLVGVDRSYGGISATLLFEEESFELSIQWIDEAYIEPPKPYMPKAVDGPMLAIVIDDMGNDFEIAKEFIGLTIPVTPAILPYLRYSKEIAHLAVQQERQHLLHMPMEPTSYPVNDPGQGAIMGSTPVEEVPALIAAALAAVPGADGINNHMGSRATQVGPLMDSVMAELDRRGLYFLDSRTSPESVAATSAKKAGVPWLKRDVFIDNIRTDEGLDERLSKSVEKAKKRGWAVAIGHHYPVTLEALKRWQPIFIDEGVTVVPLAVLLNRP
jgi:polysaccharide deacetylase 2 family uncharacterized protein YibQ